MKLPVTVGNPEAEDVQGLVCLLASMKSSFDDNIIGECFKCHRAVQFRPQYKDMDVQKICSECWLQEIQPGDHAMISQETLREAEKVKGVTLNPDGLALEVFPKSEVN